MRTVKFVSTLTIFVIVTIACSALFPGCGQQKAAIEKQKNIFRQIFEVTVNEAVNKGNLEVLDKYYAPTYVRHNPPNPDIQGLEAYKKYITDARYAFPGINLKESIEDMIIEGNLVVSRGTEQMTWKDISPTMGISPSELVNLKWLRINRIENGKCVEEWIHYDWLGFRQQLGYKISPPITENTFARMHILYFKPDKMAEVMQWYRERLVPVYKSQKGFRGCYGLNDDKTGKSVSITLWDSETEAMASMQAEDYKALAKEFADKFKGAMTAKDIREGYTVTVQE